MTQGGLWGLPMLVWKDTCPFLKRYIDLWFLMQTGDQPRDGCRAYLLTQTAEFRVRTPKYKKLMLYDFEDRIGKCTRGQLGWMRKMGHLYKRVRFSTDCFYITRGTFEQMKSTFAQYSSAVQYIVIDLDDPDDGQDFLTCPDNTEHNWSKFLRACERRRTNLRISWELDLLDRDFLRRFRTVCVSKDPRYRHLKILNAMDVCGFENANLRLDPIAAAFFLAKFPSLEHLKLQGFDVNEQVLKQLAQTAKRLKCIEILTDCNCPEHTDLNDISDSVWSRIVKACPNLTVHCCAFDKDSVEDLFSKVFKPCVPLYYIEERIEHERQVVNILRRCEAFRTTLRCINLEVSWSAKREGFSQDTVRVVFDFAVRYPQFLVFKGMKEEAAFCLVLLRKREYCENSVLFMTNIPGYS